MVCFLLNVFLQSKNVGLYYCYCGREKCQFCIILSIWKGHLQHVWRWLFNSAIMIRLFSSWKGCFKRKEMLFCCFLHDEYSYLTHDINTSENRFFTVSEIMKMIGTVQIDRMINLGIAPLSELFKWNFFAVVRKKRLWVADALPSIWKIFCMKLPILTLDLNFFLFHFK